MSKSETSIGRIFEKLSEIEFWDYVSVGLAGFFTFMGIKIVVAVLFVLFGREMLAESSPLISQMSDWELGYSLYTNDQWLNVIAGLVGLFIAWKRLKYLYKNVGDDEDAGLLEQVEDEE